MGHRSFTPFIHVGPLPSGSALHIRLTSNDLRGRCGFFGLSEEIKAVPCADIDNLISLIFVADEERVFVWHFTSASGSDLFCASDAVVIFTAARFRFRFDVGVRSAWE